MKIIITGAAGLLGSECVKQAQDLGWDVVPWTRSDLDLSHPEGVKEKLQEIKPDILLHCAAETNVDCCEKEPAHATLINETATGVLANASSELGVKMVYISSCGIFDGVQRKPYTEKDEPAPVTQYALSKYKGELRVLEASPVHLVCRVGWLFGGSAGQQKNFVEARRREAASGAKMVSANDKWGSPTWVNDASKRLFEIVETHLAGVFHVNNEGVASRHDYVSEIVKVFDSSVSVGSVDSAHFKRSAPVPDYEALTSHRFDELGMPPLRHWKEALQDYIQQEY